MLLLLLVVVLREAYFECTWSCLGTSCNT